MHPAKPGRRLGRVSGRTLLADRLRDELLDEITSAQLQPGTKLPSEGQLAKRFNVSRATVRDAVRGLVEAGYVWRPALSPAAVRRALAPEIAANDWLLWTSQGVEIVSAAAFVAASRSAVRLSGPAP